MKINLLGLALTLLISQYAHYAALAYHDEDGNGILNKRFGMIPTEGYALSNDPEVIGPPSFESSDFEVLGDADINLTMRY